MSGELKAFVVIPARNEETRVASVVDAAQSVDPSIIDTEKIIVVDNDSTDNTARRAEVAGAQVLQCPRLGKGYAMDVGAVEAMRLGAAAIVFLDADLKGLQARHINDLATPVLDTDTPMTIGYLGERKPPVKNIYNYWGAFSGQRAVNTYIWENIRETDLKGWRIEGALNAICRNLAVNHQIRRVELDGVSHIGSYEKAGGFMRGNLRYAHIGFSAVRGLFSRSGTQTETIAA